MAAVDLVGLTVRYPDGTTALEGVDLHVDDGESVVLAGPSGSGKTTLLRAVAGLIRPAAGDVRFDGRSVLDVGVADRDVALVTSEGGLYRHLDVERNLDFPLQVRGLDAQERRARTDVTSRVLRLGHLLRRRTRSLSGGERQRVALGRSTGRRPHVYLLDEPLAQLEPAERVRLAADLRTIQQGMTVPMLYVTHDQRELMTVGSRVAVLVGGRLAQVGPPMELYRRPVDMDVATALGEPPMAMVRAVADGADLVVAGTRLPLPPAARAALAAPGAPTSRTMVLGVRSEHVRVAPSAVSAEPPAAGPVLPLVVTGVQLLGDRQLVTGDLADRPASRITATFPPRPLAAVGEVVSVVIDLGPAHLFDASTRRSSYPA